MVAVGVGFGAPLLLCLAALAIIYQQSCTKCCSRFNFFSKRNSSEMRALLASGEADHVQEEVSGLSFGKS